VPAGTRQPAIKKFNAAMVAAPNEPELRARLRNAGVIPAPSTPEEFEKYLGAEIARWGKVIRDNGIKGD
jgi:tripartite-type tricarboxylate transporter receptor subunit TctC